MFRIEFDDDELEIAMQWHGGASSMLYAIASTGALRLGSRRPDPSMTDAQWFQDLAYRLSTEAEHCADIAGDDDETVSDQELLLSIAAKADAMAEALQPVIESEL